jgi:hypothetical protein
MFVVVAAACLATAVPAHGELVERGDLFVKFSGGISPTGLPRDTQAPISIHLDGTIKTLSGERPPALKRISIALNRGGELQTDGLPTCSLSQINPVSSSVALALCGPALVGEGSYLARTEYPEQAEFPARGRILAFNAVSDGHPAVLAHVYSTYPIPATRVIVFDIHRRSRGTYGTVLTGEAPVADTRYGYLKRIRLRFFRRFTHEGRRRSYLTAACAAPPGYPGAVFPFARAEMDFVDGRDLGSTLTRSCTVRN